MIQKIFFILFFLSFTSYSQKNNFLTKGDSFYLQRKTDSALTYYLKGVADCKNCNQIFVADYYLKIGKLYIKQENQPKALSYFLKAEEIYLEENDYSGLVNSKTNLAEFYRSLRELDKSNSYIESAEELIAKNDTKKEVLAYFYNRKAAITAESSDNLDEVLRLSKKAIELAKEANKFDLLLYSYNEIGYIYFRKEEFELAFDNYLKALKIADEHNYLIEKCDVLLNIGHTKTIQVYKNLTTPEYENAELYEEGRKYLKEGLQIAQEINYLQKVVDIAIELYGNSMNLRKYKEAVKYLRIHYDSKEILFLKNNKRELEKFEDAYQLKKKDEQIESDRYRITVQYFIIATFLVLCVLFLFFLNKSSRDKKNINKQKKKIEEILAQKTVLLKEIHHRVKNNLQLTSSVLYLQSNKHNSAEVTEMVQESQKHINSIALVHEMLYQDDAQSLIDIGKYLTELGNRLLQFSSNKNIAYKTYLDKIDLPIDYATTLGLILNELITNSVKHAFKDAEGIISVYFKKKDSETYSFKYSDNGVGLNNKQAKNTKNTLGTKLIKMFAEEIDATLQVENKNGLSYTFTFKNKYLKDE